MAQVLLDRVTKVYSGNVKAVDSVSLEILDKELMVLVGPSGCGKSTVLRLIAGLEEISDGTIRIGSRVVNDIPPKDRDVAMIFQNYALYPHMTVYQNMAFALKLRKCPRAEIEKRVRAAAEILGIAHLADRRPKALSGGERQRVAIGRAIVREPAVFLFDEPLSNLDAKLRVEMRKEIIRLHGRVEKTMVYVTHDQVEAMTLGDRIAVLRRGRIEQVGEPLEVFDSPNSLFVAQFIGSPPMNIFAGTLEGGAGAVVFKADGVEVPLAKRMEAAVAGCIGKKAYLGVRPKSFVPKRESPGASGRACFKGRVEVVEPLGDELLVHMASGAHKFVVSLEMEERVVVGEMLEVCPIPEKAHVFDGETERSLISRNTGSPSV